MINDIPSTLAMSSQPIQVADPWHCPVNRRGVGPVIPEWVLAAGFPVSVQR